MLYGSDYPCRGKSSCIRLFVVFLPRLYSSGLISKFTLDSHTSLEIQLEWLMILSSTKVLYIPTVGMLPPISVDSNTKPPGLPPA